jgi:hypothetical protein
MLQLEKNISFTDYDLDGGFGDDCVEELNGKGF